MYERMRDEDAESSADEIEMQTIKAAEKESDSLSDSGSPASYGSTPPPPPDKSGDDDGGAGGARTYIPCFGLMLYVMMIFGGIHSIALRTCLNEAIVAMVNETLIEGEAVLPNVSYYDQCPRDDEDPHKYDTGVFNWDRHEQSIVLSSFFLGQLVAVVRWIWDKYSLFTDGPYSRAKSTHVHHNRLNVRKQFFSCRVVNVRNSLLAERINFSSLI